MTPARRRDGTGSAAPRPAAQRRRAWGFLAAGLALALSLQACGYSFSGTSLPAHIRSIAIPMFQNETLDATIGSDVTQGITERFVSDNRLKIARAASADCVLEGRVIEYTRNVYSYNAAQQPEAYIVVIRIAVVLKDRIKNRDLWADDALTATATYPATPGTAVEADAGSQGLPQNEDEAREAAIANLAQDILARTLEQW